MSRVSEHKLIYIRSVWTSVRVDFVITSIIETNYKINLLSKPVTIKSNFKMVFNGHFRNKAYNSVRWACLYSLAPKREMRKYHSAWL